MKQKELHIVSVSGGKDSTALYCLAVEQFGMNFLPIFADTGNEHPVTVNYVRNLHTMANGPEVVIVKMDFTEKLQRQGKPVSGNPFLDMCVSKGVFPKHTMQFCTERVKLFPIREYLRENYPLHEWVMYVGLRAGESTRRSKRQPFEWNTYFDCEAVNPMLYMSEQDIYDYLTEKDVPPNPLYALGYGRVGCFPCIHASKNELSLLPEWAWEKLAEWEKAVGATWFNPGTVPRLKGLPTIEDVKLWCKTLRGGSKLDLFKQDNTADAPRCMSTWGICE